MHSMEGIVTDDKDDIFRPHGIICQMSCIPRFRSASTTLPFRNAARDSTVDIPRKLSAPCPVVLSHGALMTMASVPAARGDDITAYALLPEIVWQIFT